MSHVAIYKWIRKYVRLMGKYLDKITPQVSDTWRADELFMKFKGNLKYVFALMDNDTRFWLASEVADSKYAHDARNLLRNGKELAGKRPKVFITDGLSRLRGSIQEGISNTPSPALGTHTTCYVQRRSQQ